MFSSWWDEIEETYFRSLVPHRWLRLSVLSVLRRSVRPVVFNSSRSSPELLEFLRRVNDRILRQYGDCLDNFREYAEENEIETDYRPRSLEFPLPFPDAHSIP